MKKILLVLLVVGGAIYGNRGKLECFYYEWSGKEKPAPELYGTYVQVPPGTLGVCFYGGGRAEILNHGKRLGDPVSYVVSGRSVKITHACGVWDMQIRDGELYHKEYKSTFVKR